MTHMFGPEYAWQTARAMCEASPICCELMGMPSTVTHGTHVCGGCSDSVAARAYRAADESRPCAAHCSTLLRGRPARDGAAVARRTAAGARRLIVWCDVGLPGMQRSTVGGPVRCVLCVLCMTESGLQGSC